VEFAFTASLFRSQNISMSMSVPCLDQDFMSKKVKNASLTLEVRVEWCLCGHLVKVKQLDDFLIGSA
jgi:hypothetical protein